MQFFSQIHGQNNFRISKSFHICMKDVECAETNEKFTFRLHGVYQIDGMKFPDFSLTFPGYIFSSKYMSKFERWLKFDQKLRIWFFKSGKRREGKKGTLISKL